MNLPRVVGGVDFDVRVSTSPSIVLTARFNDERYRISGVEAMLDGMAQMALQFACDARLSVSECCEVIDDNAGGRWT